MMTANFMALKAPGIATPMLVFDPTQPIPRPVGPLAGVDRLGQNQRNRRSMILAVIRRLLMDEGHEGITVRRVAECSGHAVQTIYNLVGPRNLAIAEAVAEYSQYVRLTAMPNFADPYALVAMIDHELMSFESHPEFCRNVCNIYFTGSRDILYDCRARSTKMLHSFLVQQQKLGVIRPGVDVRSLAENLKMFMGQVFVEWSDYSLPTDHLKQRLYAGYFSMIAEAIVPSARGNEKCA